VFRPQKRKQTKLYNTLALLTLLHGSENGAIQTRYLRSITTSEMKYLRRTAGYSWTDYKTNTKIAKNLNITPVLDKIQE
jgi:hypothetical protein